MNTLLVMIVGSILTVMVRIDAQSDKTLMPGATGADVVRAVISKIEASRRFINFDEASTSSSFMRTMAYVETRDGAHPNGAGGIWNVTETLFTCTQTNDRLNTIIMQLQQVNPQNYIGPVDWRNLAYENLSTPLYSGLAVRLLIHLNPLPAPTRHSMYWVNVFETGSQHQWNMDLDTLSMEEECTLKTDVVFVLDESASIMDADFQEVKNFVYNFCQNLSIGITKSRVGVITFSTIPVVRIALNNMLDKDTLLQQIDNIPQAAQSTYTNLGLERMRQQDWRNDISVLRLAIVLTDGVSENIRATKRAAKMVHDHQPEILVFAIGVGEETNQEELEAIASEEAFLTHLDSFDPDELDSTREGYSYQICYFATQTVSVSTLKEGTIAMNATTRFKYAVPAVEGMTFRICLSDGRVTIYASTIPNPNKAQYAWRDTVRANALPLTCLSTFYGFNLNNQRRKRQQISNDTVSLYITLEGQDDVNRFTFNSSVGNTILNFECKDEPCDPNAECFNTDGYYYCMCMAEFTGNGTSCSPVRGLPITETKTRDNTLTITVSVTLFAFVTIAAVAIISGILCFAFVRKKQSQKGSHDFNEQVTDTNGPLQSENEDKMKFEASGTEQNIPTTIKLKTSEEDKLMDNND